MTVTETEQESVVERTQPESVAAAAGSLFASSDHKRLGRAFVAVSLLMTAFAFALDILVTVDGASADDFVVLDGDTFAQILSLSLDTLVYLGLIPLLLGLAMYVVPLQVGARTLAFGRAGALSLWGYLIGGGILLGSYAINGGPFGGDADGVDLYLISLGMVVVSLIVAAVCVAATVLGLRMPGLRVRDLSPFSWSAFVTAGMLIVSLPVVGALLTLLYIDHRYGRVLFGGNEGVFARLDWVFRAPQIYVVAIPALGIAAEVLTARTGSRLAKPSTVATLIGVFGIFTFGAFAQPAIVDNVLSFTDRTILEEPLYVGFVGIAVLPVLALVGLVAMSVRNARLSEVDPTIGFAVLGLLLLLAGTAVTALGVLIDATVAGDGFRLRTTSWSSGTLTLVAVGGGLTGLFAAVNWWAPKIWGRTLNGGLAVLQLLATLGGVVLVALPLMVAGAAWDQPAAATIYDAEGGAEAMSVLATVGTGLLLVAVVIQIANILVSVAGGSGDIPGPDPWSAPGLEWRTGSPPPSENFAELPALDEEEVE